MYCRKCNSEKPSDDFYSYAPTKCKSCIKNAVRIREGSLRNNPEWIQKEKKRQREKYYRLNYLEKHKPTPEKKREIMARYNNRYPEKHIIKKKMGKIKPIIDGNELHHWNYNILYCKDVIELTISEHNKLHRYMIYDQERMMYRTLEGILLDTKEKHIEYFESIKNLD